MHYRGHEAEFTITCTKYGCYDPEKGKTCGDIYPDVCSGKPNSDVEYGQYEHDHRCIPLITFILLHSYYNYYYYYKLYCYYVVAVGIVVLIVIAIVVIGIIVRVKESTGNAN